MKKKSLSVTNMGSVSLLMIFIVLCLVIFSTLSLSGTVGNSHFSEKTADHTSQYYTASNAATKKLKEIDDILASAYNEPAGSYYTTAAALLSKEDWITTDITGDEKTVRYQVPIGGSQTLAVVLALNPPDHVSTGLYRIISWREITTREWNGNDSLQLMEG